MKQERIKEWFLAIAAHLVRFKSELEILECSYNHGLVTLKVRAHEEDTPRLIGSGGSNFNAMRILLALLADTIGAHVFYRIEEPKQTSNAEFRKQPFIAKEDWQQDAVEDLLELVCNELFDEWDFDVENQKRGQSIITLATENKRLRVDDATIQEAFNRLFASIGRMKGRKLFVRFSRKEPNESVPTTRPLHGIQRRG